MKRPALALAAAILAVSPAGAVKTVPRADVDHLRGLVRSGDCRTALVGVEALRRRYPEDPDLFVIEANCLLAASGREETRFVPEAYRELIARAQGALLSAETRRALYETRIVYPPEDLARAHALLDEAIRRAPFRGDLYLGRCYLLQETGEHEALLEAIAVAAKRVPDEETSKALLSYVDAYLARRQPGRALDVAQTIAEHFGSKAYVWATVARARLARGDLDGARRAYAQARSQDVTDVRILAAAAEVEILARSWAEATETLASLLERKPRDDVARFNIAWCKARSLPFEAVKHLQSLLVDSQGRGSPMHKSAVQLQEMLSIVPPPTADDWFAFGVRQAEGRLHGAALAAWDYALELDPAHADALQAMTALYATLGLPDQARGVYGKMRAVLLEPDDAAPLLDSEARIAWSYLAAGRDGDALEVYRAAVDPVQHAFDLAAIHESRGEVAEARRWLERAAENPALAGEARRRLAELSADVAPPASAEETSGAPPGGDGGP